MFWRSIIIQGDQGNVSATLRFMESSYFPVFISYIYQIVLLQQATIFKKWTKQVKCICSKSDSFLYLYKAVDKVRFF